jgi:hypothetical protein
MEVVRKLAARARYHVPSDTSYLAALAFATELNASETALAKRLNNKNVNKRTRRLRQCRSSRRFDLTNERDNAQWRFHGCRSAGALD